MATPRYCSSCDVSETCDALGLDRLDRRICYLLADIEAMMDTLHNNYSAKLEASNG